MKLNPLPTARASTKVLQVLSGSVLSGSAPAHIADISMLTQQTLFDVQIISRAPWSSHSPDMNVCDYYLW
jgi:hypothetical protein